VENLGTEIAAALDRVIAGDPEIWQILLLSVRISTTAVLAAAFLGIPFGVWVGLTPFRGRRWVELALDTAFGLPTVLVGLILYAIFCRRGPLGMLNLLYTPTAIGIGQFVLATPLLAALARAGVRDLDPRVLATARTIGAGTARTLALAGRECRYAMGAAVLAALGRVLTEVGSAMMLGGNIRGETRTMTTAIALETSRGDFGMGIALGIVLLGLSLAIAVAAGFLRSRHAHRD
jgi:tungstate transport system permease protein